MTKTRFSGVLLAALATIVFLPGAASADPTSTLSLMIEAGDQGVASTVELQCYPDGGTHPNAVNACSELTLVNGDFEQLPVTPGPAACTMEFRPVTASARGFWNGEKVKWDKEFSNPCTMHSGTGTVFGF
jgi:subtilisin inhibitor-like